MSALHHLLGRFYWDEQTDALLERDDEHGDKVRELFGRFRWHCDVPSLEDAWRWVTEPRSAYDAVRSHQGELFP